MIIITLICLGVLVQGGQEESVDSTSDAHLDNLELLINQEMGSDTFQGNDVEKALVNAMKQWGTKIADVYVEMVHPIMAGF